MTESTETTVARLDERFRAFQVAFAQMADDQRRMAESYEKLVENNQRVSLLEADMVAMKAGMAKLWEKYDELDANERAADKRRLDADEKARDKWYWELVKAALTAGVTLALFHFGVRP